MIRHLLLALLALPTALTLAQERIPVKGLAATGKDGTFAVHAFDRRPVGEGDILLDILYAGICHSDLHHVASDWGPETYPMVPGHEILGRVAAIGPGVTSFKVGDLAGVGCMVGSCGVCPDCKTGEEQYCAKGAVMTYHGKDYNHGDEPTQGGYSTRIVLPAAFAIHVPKGVPLERVAPLFCAGITTYSPIRRAGVKAGWRVGVAGFGGLGHMAVKYAVSLGAEVTVFDITEAKRADALRLGAKRYVNVNDPKQWEGLAASFDFILSTIPAKYAPVDYLRLLKRKGKLGIVGVPAFADMPTLSVADIVFTGDRDVFGSQIGGIRETQEMLDYSVAHGLYPDVEVIAPTPEAVEKAYRDVRDGKSRFRVVIDMQQLK